MKAAAAGPVQVRATVLTARRVDAYHALTLVAPPIAARFRPGQFITVAVGGPQTSMVGRRAFAVHGIEAIIRGEVGVRSLQEHAAQIRGPVPPEETFPPGET